MARAPDLDQRFAHFCRTGEPAALGEVFDGTARELLHVAVWLAGNRTDAEDLLQRTFLAAIETRARFAVGQRVLPWLLGLLATEARHLQRERGRKVGSAVPSSVPAPEDVAAAQELESAVRAVRAELSEPYRDVLRLHLEQGLNAKEIAARLRRPAGTVRTQLVRALELLRRRLPTGFVAGLAPVPLVGWNAPSGVREAVMAAATRAVPVASGPVAALAASGSMTMSKKVTVLASALLLLAGAVAWTLRAPEEQTSSRTTATVSAEAKQTVSDEAPDAARRTLVGEPALVAGAATGSLEVRLVWGYRHDQARDPAANVGVAVVPEHDYSNLHERLGVTDTTGICAFVGLEPGRYLAKAAFVGSEVTAVERGTTATLTLSVGRELTVRGRVVDEYELPVEGADIWLSEEHNFNRGYVVARSDAEGRFLIAAGRTDHCLGARKAGRVPSYWRDVNAKEGQKELEFTLQLRGTGGSVRGRVVDENRRPLAGARVLIGEEIVCQAPGTRGLYAEKKPRGSTVVTGSDGTFSQDGVEPGPTELQAWAEGRAPGRGGVVVAAAAVAEAELVLLPAATLIGTVRDAQGKAVAGCTVQVGRTNEFFYAAAKSDAEGSYRLTNLPSGDIAVTASSGEKLQDKTRIELPQGGTARWDPVLAAGRVLRGVVVDEAGQPCAGVYVVPQAWLVGESRESQQTDASGTFAFTNVRNDALYVLDVQRGGARLARAAVPPGQDEVRIVVDASTMSTASVRLRLLDAGGQPFAAKVFSWELGGNEGLSMKQDGATGIARSDKLRPGRYALQVQTTEMTMPLTEVSLLAHEDRDLGDFTVPAPGRVRLHAHTADGRPVPRGWVEMVSNSGDSCLSNPPPIENGEVELTVPPGTWTAVVNTGTASGAVPVEVRSGATCDLQLTLPPGREVPLQVVPEASGLAVGMFRVLARDAAGRIVACTSVITQRDGSNTTVLRLPPGDYEVTVTGRAGSSGAAKLVVSADAAVAPLRIELHPPVR